MRPTASSTGLPPLHGTLVTAKHHSRFRDRARSPESRDRLHAPVGRASRARPRANKIVRVAGLLWIGASGDYHSLTAGDSMTPYIMRRSATNRIAPSATATASQTVLSL